MVVINVLIFAILIFVCRAQEGCPDEKCPEDSVCVFKSEGSVHTCVEALVECPEGTCTEGYMCIKGHCYGPVEEDDCIYSDCDDENECHPSGSEFCFCADGTNLFFSCQLEDYKGVNCKIGKGCHCGDEKCDSLETCDLEEGLCLCGGLHCEDDEMCDDIESPHCITSSTTTTTTTTTTTSTTTTTTTTTTAKPCVDSNDNCKQSAGLCQNTAYVALMKSVCPFTCGYCTPPASTCVDVASNCLTNQRYCTDASLLVLMKAYCPATCGYCSASCTNKADDCSSKTQYCKQTAYVSLMKAMCAAACGYC